MLHISLIISNFGVNKKDMNKYPFRPYVPEQTTFVPQCLDEDIPENDPVRIVSAMVDEIDIEEFASLYSGGGRFSYHPRMMLKLVLFAYMNNTYSCRRIEKAVRRDGYFRWLAGGERPDFATINRFRNRMSGMVDKLFSMFVSVLKKEGFLSIEVLHVDGTKVQSRSNRYRIVWKRDVDRDTKRLGEQSRVLGDRNSYARTDMDATFMKMKD